MCVRASRDFQIFFDVLPTVVKGPSFCLGSSGTKGGVFLSLIINLGWTIGSFAPYQLGLKHVSLLVVVYSPPLEYIRKLMDELIACMGYISILLGESYTITTNLTPSHTRNLLANQWMPRQHLLQVG